MLPGDGAFLDRKAHLVYDVGEGKGPGYSVAIAEFVPRLLFFYALDL